MPALNCMCVLSEVVYTFLPSYRPTFLYTTRAHVHEHIGAPEVGPKGGAVARMRHHAGAF